MKTIESNKQLLSLLAELKGKTTIGFVPTMGNLHAGHLKLVEAARAECETVICSIFVNPTQFGPNEDLANYPRTLDADRSKLQAAGCDIVYVPSVDQLYDSQPGAETVIHVPGVSENFCGSSRPGHFDGVATVVCKLLSLVQPTVAYFGLKDYQQFLVIKKLVNDLLLQVTVKGIETERELSGLAMSSRNGYLDANQKETASNLYATLKRAAKEIMQTQKDFKAITDESIEQLESAGLSVDYFAICNSNNLAPAVAGDRELVVLAAVYLSKTRLIDNIRVNL